MGQLWENPDYGNYRRRRIRLTIFLSLATIAASLFWIWRHSVPEDGATAFAEKSLSRSTAVLRSVPQELEAPGEEAPLTVTPDPQLPIVDVGREVLMSWQAADALFLAGKFNDALEAYRRLAATIPASRGRAGMCLIKMGRWREAIPELQAALDWLPNDFAARKLLSQALYRQNELEPALEQVQAALALVADGELLELKAKLQKEIRVQRNYTNARTDDFVVLFDGYEHDGIKREVLDILKDAHAEIGKELDHFPEQPISVILYTARSFSDVTSAPLWAGGLFGKIDGKIRLPVQGTEGQQTALRRLLYHEYTHALLFSMAPDCPLWLHEGLAQFLSGDKPVRTGQVIPLTLLVDGFPSETRAAYAAYMESLQAVHDLLEEYGMPRLRRLLIKLGGGSDLDTAFASVYGQPFSRWAKNWRPLPRQE